MGKCLDCDTEDGMAALHFDAVSYNFTQKTSLLGLLLHGTAEMIALVT